jgi:hypothetical protein
MEGSRKIPEPALGYCWMCKILFIMHSLNHTLSTLNGKFLLDGGREIRKLLFSFSNMLGKETHNKVFKQKQIS